MAYDGEELKTPRRRRHSVARGSGTRLLFFGGWSGTRTTDEMLELDTSPLIRSDAQPARSKKGKKAPPPRSDGRSDGRSAADGFRSECLASASAAAEAALELQLERHEGELKQLRGEVARLKVANALLTRDMARMKVRRGEQKKWRRLRESGA